MGGLPFHDFYNSDASLAQKVGGKIDKFVGMIEREYPELEIFDFMKSYELEHAMGDRKVSYEHSKVSEFLFLNEMRGREGRE